MANSPVFSKPRSVERPERVKYYATIIKLSEIKAHILSRTKGRKMMDTISSSFSVIVIASPPSRGTIKPTRNAPKSRNTKLEAGE
jgi:hypothetical protein